MGFEGSKCDPSLFILTKTDSVTYLLVYVDDIIITGSCSQLVQHLINQLDSYFSLKRLGQLDYFLGIEAKHLSNGSLLLTQAKYVRDLLAKSKMTEATGISSPMIGGQKLSKTGSDPFSDPTLYRSIVGALQYATITRPELCYSVNKVCQFMASPLESHWKAVKRILRYLKGTLSHGLLLRASGQLIRMHLCLSHAIVMQTGQQIRMIEDQLRSTSGACVYPESSL